MKKEISDETIKTIAASFIKQAQKYGFTLNDYLRFTNYLLDEAMQALSLNTEKKETTIYLQGSIKKLPLETERLIIRQTTKKDLSIIKSWLEDKEGRFFLLSRLDNQQETIDEVFENENNLLGTICLKDKTPIGLIAYLNIDEYHRKAELRKMIGVTKERGKGYGNEATKAWIEYGFFTLNLEKIYLTTINTDIKNIRINEALGFRVEGLLRNELKINGEYYDVLQMSLLKEWVINKENQK
ncbi:MAG: GNAT family N-acetyltransferase [Ignavibacteria bacterium]|jgi:RimJ/RimL family protein N-acetyltransferase|nr:GNAT family N-acetyltransferase [Ignavibacteria bacterium]MDH7528690.1 GNAT family protein [Ignavibacteria bacterium]